MQSARTISRVWGRHSPTSFPRGTKPQNCGFWHRGRNLLSVTTPPPHFRPPLFPGLYKCFLQIFLCLLLVHWEPLLAIYSPFLLLLILQRAFLPAFAKMTPDALVSTRCWQKSCPLLSTTGKTSKMPNTNAEKSPSHLLLQPAWVKMAGSGAGQQKSSKSFARLTAFAGRAGGG